MYNLQLNERILKFSRQKLALESTAKIVGCGHLWRENSNSYFYEHTNSVNVDICLSRVSLCLELEQFED